MSTADVNLAWADAFVAGLAAAGLLHVVVAPGARSAPLALAALRRPELRCHVISDERAAGYFALGIGRGTRRPAAVVCTSGTAVANLLPAIMEANLACVPLLVITADRPAEAYGWGANQTVDQIKIFGSQTRAFHHMPTPTGEVDTGYLRAMAARVVGECMQLMAGPVHVNQPFREPLLPASIPEPAALPEAVLLSDGAIEALPAESLDAIAARLSGRCGVLVCGAADVTTEFTDALTLLAECLDAPILAEPLTNLRHGARDRSRILAHQARFLRHADLPEPDWVLRFGAFPVSRVVERWLASLKRTYHVLVAPPHQWPDPHWRSGTVVHTDALALAQALHGRVDSAPTAWCEQWQATESAAASQVADLCDAAPLFEGSVARQLLAAAPADAQVFVGNSLAIRAVDAFTGTLDKRLRLHGNRGASGIDGNLATAAGIAAGTNETAALLLGDQAVLHDCGSLALFEKRDVVVVVVDNGGGGIFDHLPFAPAVPAELFARGWTAPPRVDFAALARAFGMRYVDAPDLETLRPALSTAFNGGAWLLRVPVERSASRAQFAR
jgi:2-succinyl-5-enolpyruvyl-6-hydroxy-3-cyclohexene-1-carboxylate synthase